MNKKTYDRLFCEVVFLKVKDVLIASAYDNDVESGGGLGW